MIAFNSTYFYLIVCSAHMKIFLLYIRNTSFIFIYLFVIIIIIISGYKNTENVFYSLQMAVLIINVLQVDEPITAGRGK